MGDFRKFLFLSAILALLPLAAQSQESRGFREAEVESGEPIEGKQWALLIGNNKYESPEWPELKTAVKDVEDLANILIGRYGYEKERVLVRRNATRRAMLRGFIELSKKAKPEDSVLIYYAGHGEYDKNERGWWIPVDGIDSTDYISNEEILARLRTIKTRHILLIADSCFSGNLLTRGASRPSDRDRPLTGYYKEKSKLISVQGLSSGGSEPVSDGGAEWGGNSIFAYHLLGVLRANQQPQLAGSRLGLKLAEVVANDTASVMGVGQTPVFSSIKNQGDQGGEFFFLAKDIRSALKQGVALFWMPSERAQPGRNLAAAGDIIGQELIKQLNARKLNPGDEIFMLKPGNIEKQIEKRLEEGKVNSALVIILKGTLQKQDTLLWKGLSNLDVNLTSYRMEGGGLSRLASRPLATQTLPMRKWTEKPDMLEAQFGKTAHKLVRKWSQENVDALLSRFEKEDRS